MVDCHLLLRLLRGKIALPLAGTGARITAAVFPVIPFRRPRPLRNALKAGTGPHPRTLANIRPAPRPLRAHHPLHLVITRKRVRMARCHVTGNAPRLLVR